MFPGRRKTLGIDHSKKRAKPVKKGRLIRKRNDDDSAWFMANASEFMQDFKRVQDMLQDFQTKYGFTRDQMKVFI